MEIKKTTLTYFDEQEERVRLENEFEGCRKRLLLLILVAFVEGDWTMCLA